MIEISYQNILTLDVGVHIISQFNIKDFALASRVCRNWYNAIKSREEVWGEKLEQIKFYKEHMVIPNNYPEGISTLYEKYQFLINNAFQKTVKEPSLLSTSTFYVIVDSTDPVAGKQYYLCDNSRNYVKLITEQEKEELKAKREQAITRINDAFHHALFLYSCDVRDKSYVHDYIVFAEKEKILLKNRFLFALALFFKEGNPADFFSLEDDRTENRLTAVKELVSISLQQGDCEQALEWIKRYVVSTLIAFDVEKELMVRFGQQAIDKQKREVFEELLSHLLSLDIPGAPQNAFRQKAFFKQEIKNHVLLVLQELRDKGYAEIVDSLAKKLSL